MCTTGRSNLCENLRFFGCGYEQGGMADFFTIPADRLHVIPDGMTDLQAALIEPLSTPVHAVRLSGGVRDKAVVIIGAGTIGLLVLAAARHDGARRIVMTDLVDSKRQRALRLGADAVLDADRPDLADALRAELGESADVVFDCVAVQSTVTLAVKTALRAGTVVIVGVPAAPVTVPLAEIQDLQVRIQGSTYYMPEDYAAAIRIIEAGEVRAEEDFITSQLSFDDAATAFASSAGRRPGSQSRAHAWWLIARRCRCETAPTTPLPVPVGRYEAASETWTDTEAAGQVDRDALTVSTYNIWFDSKHAEQRYLAIAALLSGRTPDIMVFQEVTPAALDVLLAQPWVRARYLRAAVVGDEVGNYGMLLLSRVPISGATYTRLPSRQQRGFLQATLGLNGTQTVVCCIHLDSGKSSAGLRGWQLRRIFRALRTVKDALILGDFNMRDTENWRIRGPYTRCVA